MHTIEKSLCRAQNPSSELCTKRWQRRCQYPRAVLGAIEIVVFASLTSTTRPRQNKFVKVLWCKPVL